MPWKYILRKALSSVLISSYYFYHRYHEKQPRAYKDDHATLITIVAIHLAYNFRWLKAKLFETFMRVFTIKYYIGKMGYIPRSVVKNTIDSN